MINSIKLLVLAPKYKYFIKDQVEALSSYVDEIEVAIRYNPLVEVSNLFPIGDKFTHFRKYTKKSLADFDDIPKNVKISFIRTIYIVPDGSNKSVGDKIFKNICRWIEDQKIKFDLIHAHFTWPYGYVGRKLKDKYNIPLIITAHGYDVYDLPFRDIKWNTTIRGILIASDHIITVSKNNRDKLMQLDYTTDRISIIPNGYDPSLFRQLSIERMRKKLNLLENKKIILSVGDLELVKGHKYLVEALNIIARQDKNVLCIVVGSGSQEKSLKKLINNLDLGDQIKLVDSKPHAEIPFWMNACDLFVHPSLNEGNPTVMFEALGCGKPFVGTRVGGIPEIIINDKLGILVEPEDPECLAKAIQRALDTEWDEGYISEYAKQFTWDNIAKRIIEAYESVMKMK